MGNGALPEQADSLILRDVRVLSNLLKRGDVVAAGAPGEHRPAQPNEVPDALGALLGGGGAPADPARVTEFIEFTSHRGIDMADLWLARRGGRIVWAALPIISPGKTMLVVAGGASPADAGPVVDALCDLARGRGVHLAQTLLDPADEASRELFKRHGFAELTELLYLHVLVRKPLPAPALPEGFSWATYSPQTHEQFAQTILRSYEGSLDCPALNGLREIEDIIAGHKAAGEFDPRFWFLLREGEAPRAVLLLSRVPRADGLELVYLGLAPEARGRGLGDLLMRQATWAVREMNVALLSLAVDAGNAPALNLYYRHGLQRIGSKLALMKDLRPAEQAAR